MFSAFVALLTPQLREDCSEFYISADQESWIGKYFLFFQYGSKKYNNLLKRVK